MLAADRRLKFALRCAVPLAHQLGLCLSPVASEAEAVPDAMCSVGFGRHRHVGSRG